MTIALCCDDEISCEKAEKQISSLCAVPVRSFFNNRDFISLITNRPDIVMIIAQKGARSTETAMSAREQNPDGKLIWLSDLDFALLSFRLKAAYFGLFPIDDEKLKVALSYCGIVAENKTDGDGA